MNVDVSCALRLRNELSLRWQPSWGSNPVVPRTANHDEVVHFGIAKMAHGGEAICPPYDLFMI